MRRHTEIEIRHKGIAEWGADSLENREKESKLCRNDHISPVILDVQISLRVLPQLEWGERFSKQRNTECDVTGRFLTANG